MNSQNERDVSKEAEVRNTTLVMNSSSNGNPSLDESEFNKKIQEIQAMARQARMIEQQSSKDFSEQQDGDYPSNSRTMGRNIDGIREEDSPSSLNMMIREAQDYRNPDESNLNTLGNTTKINTKKEVGSQRYREDQRKPKVDTLQYGQNSAGKVAKTERKESVDGRSVKKGFGKKNGFGANKSSLKSSQRNKPPGK